MLSSLDSNEFLYKSLRAHINFHEPRKFKAWVTNLELQLENQSLLGSQGQEL